MNNNHKTLYLALTISIFSFAIPNAAFADEMPKTPQLEEIEKSQEKKSPTMQTKSWNNPNPKDTKDDEKQAEKEDGKSDKEKTDEPELTEDQKIWNKYKELADKNKGEDEDVGSDEDVATAEDIEPTDVNAEGVEEESEKESTGIVAILERYKNSQKGKGNMTTRSLGSID